MTPRDTELTQQLQCSLDKFEQTRPLPGISDVGRRAVFIEQMLESIHRVRYISVIRGRTVSPRRLDPHDEHFDPLKAAIHSERQGEIDEACWMVFFFVHFGKHRKAGWRYAREVYGRLGDRLRWDWNNTSKDPDAFRQWLAAHQDELRHDGVSRGFGNHRKYQSLDAYSNNGTGSAFESYISWVGSERGHGGLIAEACARNNNDRRRSFHDLFQSMKMVASFGRLARFDYLSMLGKLRLAHIEPGSAYLSNSTGPLQGAKLLFENTENASGSLLELDRYLVELDAQLGLEFGLQVLEDALCNWQKSPDELQRFSG